MQSMEDRFWAKVDKSGNCWNWAAGKRRGYGRFVIKNKSKGAHRVSWEMANGKIPDGSLVCHSCDNPSCVNPDHLFLGTHATNNKDRDEKGRAVYVRGDKHGNSKLNEIDIFLIRELEKPHNCIADFFDISASAVSAIKTRRNWAHIA